ncbi:cation-translocating P-type ATPase [Longispora albida]|uniref:cation-translocating P-type ATPase n=1 Tax=Longispora albida TaxID=203523 RepID=UPI001FE00EDF|nr:cation-transporting P-type ATPase [Longispora albida]
MRETAATTSETTPPLRGLEPGEVAALLARHGPNTTPVPPPRRLASRVGEQLREPLILLLLGAMAVTIVLRDVSDTIVIALVIVLNTTVGIRQEIRADRAVAALRELAAPHARVVRSGQPQVIPAAELVPGDVVRVEAGDIVPADLALAEAAQLTVDEAALTGESVPVTRGPGGELSGGTVVAAGRGCGVVTRTGPASALGQITALVAAQPRKPTPLQRRLAGLSRAIGAVVVAVSALVMVLGMASGRPAGEMLLVAVSLTVAAVPESLPAVVTVALALGAFRMARRSAVVRQLPAVETLGSVTVLAADKTGTLTEGVMAVEKIACGGSVFTVDGRGYDPAGTVQAGADPQRLRRLALAMLLCNDADLVPPAAPGERWRPAGDPMEAALVTAAARCGVEAAERDRYPRVLEFPFDAVRRRMSTVHEAGGEYLVLCKGAPESVLNHDVLHIAGDDLAEAETLAASLASAGLRVLAVASDNRDSVPAPERAEAGLTLLGLVALGDPIREGAVEVARQFERAGIRLILITGDHPATARAIGTQIGIIDGEGEVLPGDGDFDPGRLAHVRVFARTRPERKLAIVRALQDRGEIVAMTGDGVNDAPALRAADIGVAMGKGGTEAARQAAHLVLADDNLATAAAAVAEGRRIYANIRRFLAYGLAGGLAEVLVMLAGPFAGFAVPLLPAQILWINMLTHGLPGVALGAEPGDRDAMHQPPRRPGSAILGGGLAAQIAVLGALITLVAGGMAIAASRSGWPWQTVLFTTLGLAQLGVALAVRARPEPGQARTWWLPAAVALSLGGQLAALWLPPLRTLLGTESLNLNQLLACVAAASVPGIALAAFRTITAPRR